MPRLASFVPLLRQSVRSYATGATPNTLVLLEHKNSKLVPAALNAVTAARKLGGTVTGLVVGGSQDQTGQVAESAKR